VSNTEKEIIETFCRELTLALRRITGETIDIQPDFLAGSCEGDQPPVWVQNPPVVCNDLLSKDHSYSHVNN
jgi:hypothetical protein